MTHETLDSSELSPIIVPLEKGAVYSAFGDEVTIRIRGDDTGGKYTMFTTITPPGSGPPPHYHLREDEWFYVLEGKAEFFLDGEWTEAPVGTAAFMPRGSVHTFRNAGESPLKLLVNVSPSGFEVFFSRCAAEFLKPGAPDMGKLMEIAAEHGIHFVM